DARPPAAGPEGPRHGAGGPVVGGQHAGGEFRCPACARLLGSGRLEVRKPVWPDPAGVVPVSAGREPYLDQSAGGAWAEGGGGGSWSGSGSPGAASGAARNWLRPFAPFTTGSTQRTFHLPYAVSEVVPRAEAALVPLAQGTEGGRFVPPADDAPRAEGAVQPE